MVACPVCAKETLTARGLYEICDYCWWEDEGTDNPDCGGGPNGGVSLGEARRYVAKFGPLPESTADAWIVFEKLSKETP